MTLFRTILFTLMVVLFVQQSRQAPAHSYRQRAFALATGAFGLFALLNALRLIGVNTDSVLLIIYAVAVTLLGVSVVLLYRAWKRGEMKEQIGRMHEALEEERNRRSNH